MCAVAVPAIAAQAPPPQPPPTFSSTAQVVEVDVRVFDKDGHFVPTLGPRDFEVVEDGVSQKIDSVALISRATEPPAATSSGEAPASPAAGGKPVEAGPQVWLFVFDTVHLTPNGLRRTQQALSQFVAGRLHAGDIGGVVADGKMANNRLTSDREELKRAVDAVKMTGDARSRSLTQREWPRMRDEFEALQIANGDREALQSAVVRACSDEPSMCRMAPADAQVLEKARRMASEYAQASLQTLSVVQTLAGGLARMPGSKTVVFVSEGFVLQQQEAQLRRAVGMATRAGARFYSIDARGLNKGANAEIIDRAHADSPTDVAPRFDAKEDGVNALAVDTGGFAIRNDNDFGRALDDIQRDAATYYVLAYRPSNETFDGQYRTIQVKVARSDVRVRARRGYLALPPARLLTMTRATAPASATARPTEAPAPTAPSAPGAPGPIPPSAQVPTAASEASGAVADPATTTAVPVAPPAIALVPPLPPARAVPDAPPPAPAARLTPTAVIAALGKTAASADDPASRGWAAYERGDVDTAAAELKTAAADPASAPWVSYVLGLSQFARRQYREAAQSWERVRVHAPEFEPIYFSLADAYSVEHEESTAIKVLREAEQRWPRDPEVANAIGVMQVRRGALDAAIESFDRAVALAPADSIGYFNLGRAHQMRMLKMQRYVPETKKWMGGDADKKKAVANYQRHIDLGGPYAQQAREALAQLGWS